MTARTFTRQAGLGLALACACAPALAQDPPARVGRIAYLSGPVSFAPEGSADWAQAPLNRPLVAGDRLWTDAGARDEAQFGAAIARMDAGTFLTVLAADERTTQLQVSQGRIDLHVRGLADGETVEVDTPNLAFVARRPGDYRLSVAPDGSTTDVTVLRGAADVYGDGTSLALAPGQAYRFGGQDLNNYVLLQPAPPDDFDRWALGRDRRYERAVARRATGRLTTTGTGRGSIRGAGPGSTTRRTAMPCRTTDAGSARRIRGPGCRRRCRRTPCMRRRSSRSWARC
jgi:hypothetical protein